MARITANQPHMILRFLDTGIHWVHVPWVNTAAAVERAAQSVTYQPRGRRGLVGSRASDGGMYESMGEYTKRANRETAVDRVADAVVDSDKALGIYAGRRPQPSTGSTEKPATPPPVSTDSSSKVYLSRLRN